MCQKPVTGEGPESAEGGLILAKDKIKSDSPQRHRGHGGKPIRVKSDKHNRHLHEIVTSCVDSL